MNPTFVYIHVLQEQLGVKGIVALATGRLKTLGIEPGNSAGSLPDHCFNFLSVL